MSNILITKWCIILSLTLQAISPLLAIKILSKSWKIRMKQGGYHWSQYMYEQGWKLKFWSTRLVAEWPSSCTRPNKFSLNQSPPHTFSKMVNLVSFWLVDRVHVHYFNMESRKLHLFWIIYSGHSGYDNRTRQSGWVIRDLYSPDSFYTRLGERASANFQPRRNTKGFQ